MQADRDSGRDEADDEAPVDDGEEAPRDDSGADIDISDTTAPSIGPGTVINKESAETRLARHEQSDTDAMGLDKRREVIGGSYSASVGRQAATYGIALGVIAAIAFGVILLVNKADQPPDKYKDAAPWAKSDAPQVKPTPLQ